MFMFVFVFSCGIICNESNHLMVQARVELFSREIQFFQIAFISARFKANGRGRRHRLADKSLDVANVVARIPKILLHYFFAIVRQIFAILPIAFDSHIADNTFIVHCQRLKGRRDAATVVHEGGETIIDIVAAISKFRGGHGLFDRGKGAFGGHGIEIGEHGFLFREVATAIN